MDRDRRTMKQYEVDLTPMRGGVQPKTVVVEAKSVDGAGMRAVKYRDDGYGLKCIRLNGRVVWLPGWECGFC